MIFKNQDLEIFYRKINSLGSTQLFKDWNGEKAFLIRHDVDFDIKLAYNMAKLEYENNIVSTYFILVSCESYNIFSKRNKKLLREIINYGHEIGLHFDPTNYKDNLDEAVESEINSLSFVVGQEIKSISLHNPTFSGQYPMFEGYINTYSPEYFDVEHYISDSCFSFRGKDPLSFLKNINYKMCQILLHPMHFTEKGDGYDDIVVNSFIDYMQKIHEDFSLVNSKYRDHVGKDFLSTFKNKIK